MFDVSVQYALNLQPQQQLRTDESAYGALPEDLRKRYEPSRHQLFGGWKKDDDWMVVTIHAKPLRISQRRKTQETDEFKIKYRRRSGIESTNSLLKRVTGLGRLRVRGKASVFQSLLLKVAGWNILRAASSKRLMCSLKGLFAAFVRLIEQIEKRAQMMALPRQMIAKQLRQNQGVSHEKLCENAGKAPTFVGCVQEQSPN